MEETGNLLGFVENVCKGEIYTGQLACHSAFRMFLCTVLFIALLAAARPSLPSPTAVLLPYASCSPNTI